MYSHSERHVSINSDIWLIFIKVLQGQKWRRGKGGPATGPNWDPTQGEAPRLDTITEAMEQLLCQSSQKRPLFFCWFIL